MVRPSPYAALKMKRRETTAGVTNPSTISSVRIPRNISVHEAKTFWQNQRKEGTVDVMFKKVQSKLQLLCQKIKAGAATNQDYMRALMLVNNVSDLEDSETSHSDQNSAEELPEDEDCLPVRAEEPLPSPINSNLEKNLPSSESESSEAAPSLTTKHVLYQKHRCGPICLSSVSPYFSKRENPLKFPVLCHFQRRHAKSSLISRQLDVIYKTPCGKGLQNFDDVRSYLNHTKCRFLSVDHFSFNTYLQLDRNLVKNQVVFQEADISKDTELVPVPLCNEIDKTRPAPFTYRKSPWPRGYSINNFTDLFRGCCDCTDGCLDVSKCVCLQLTTKDLGTDVTLPERGIAAGYKYKQLQTPVPTGLYECNVSCKCDRKMCQNRVVQHGLQVRLQVFKTKGKGWGVRCMDDLDKGTFVCIYAGRILMKTVGMNTGQDTTKQTHAKKTTTICAGKKRGVSHSDSEITTSPSISSITQKFRLTPLHVRKGFCRANEGKLNYTGLKRPKTKTSILQKRRRQLIEQGTMTVQHSSDEELFTPPASPKKLLPGPCENDDETVKVRCAPMGNSVLNNEAGYVSDESSSSVQGGAEEKSDLPDSKTGENVFFLDASTEGNVGRFLNHSCSPNLFVQHVFVETHSKNFPWVAFFTKSFIKAGTELTWEYNYDIGTVPEMEISCLCGHKKCKNKII
ncbi:histone-lysine N-methyltransferase SETDB2 isoform X2 [Phyllobates terribilis]|uniref:histone-lysine N-methyltransferase SETDB2 isoform X2 n=1 Tax=Phyllobates terribilis TaxID=111132 RepID=UPI003CCB5525